MIKKKQNRYGGADKPFEWISSHSPISSMIVGRKSGREAKETLLFKTLALRCDLVRKTIIPAEIHDSRKKGLRVQESIEHLLKPESFAAVHIQFLVPGNKVIANLLLTLCQELSIGNAIRKEKVWECSKQTGRYAFDNK